MRNLILFTTLCYLIMLGSCDSCQLPSETSPVSICTFCSSSHAGMRWMVHSSNGHNIHKGVNSINFEFHCDNLEENETYDHDDCFNGLQPPGVNTIQTDVWRWHILERQFQMGTKCTFTAIIKNVWGDRLPEIHSTCTVAVKNISTCFEGCVVPDFKCSGNPGDSICPCNCGLGFTTHITSVGLLCRNIDECSLRMHHCANANECVDTEGSYHCQQYDGSGRQPTLAPYSSNLGNGLDEPYTSTINEITVITETTAITTLTTTSGVPNTKVQTAITIVSLLAILATLVVVASAIALKRYLSKSELKSPWCTDKFDPGYNPVTIDENTNTKTKASLQSILHNLDVSVDANTIVKDLDTDSYVRTVACEILQTDQVSNSEESSMCSQILDETSIELQSERSSLTVDSNLILDKHTTNQQQMPVTVNPTTVCYPPQSANSSDCTYIKLDLHKDQFDCDYDVSYKNITVSQENVTIICANHDHTMNSVRSGYEDSCYVMNQSHHDVHDKMTPVFFEFPHNQR